MRSTKCLLIVFFVSIMLFLIPNTSNAAVEYTRIITGNDGSITVNLTGLELDTTKPHEFALVLLADEPTTWHGISDFTANTATVELNSATPDVLNVLKTSDRGFLYIREKDNTETYKLNNFEIDLKLPYLNGANISVDNTGAIELNGIYYNPNASGNSATFCWEKITDRTVIQKFIEHKTEGKNIQASDLKQTIPSAGFSSNWSWTAGGYTMWKSACKDDGLYYFWVKTTGVDCKTMYGYYLYDGLPDAKTVSDYIHGEGPKVRSIEVNSPVSGTYKTGQTVKIRVYFDKEITGTTVPTLRIKFGNSPVRDVTNGTIHNNGAVQIYRHYIEYSYNIQAGDNGQLATESLTGGTIKDTDGNNAVLTCPVLTGSITIKANTEGTITNNTENQDKTNNETEEDKNSTSNKNESTSNKNDDKNSSKNESTSNKNDKDSSKNESTSNKKDDEDDTTVKGKIPYTGVGYAVIVAIAIVLIIGMIAKAKYNGLKDIK